jgi:hypothetical protein
MRMTRSMIARAGAALTLWLAALASPAQAQAPRWIPEAGSHPYRYETVTHVPGAPGQRFRIDYDLLSDGKGGVVAVVKAAAKGEADGWVEIDVDDTCRTALRGQGDELARVTLWPLAPEVIATLGPDFMADCAPTEVFFPLTDVLNLTLIQVAPHFRLNELAKPGDRRPFPGHSLKLDRLDTVLDTDSSGGMLDFAALAPGRATIEWQANPAKIHMVHRRAFNGVDVTFNGTETAIYRLEIDPRTGVLLNAASTRADLDVIMSLPGDYTQPMKITREMKITRP